MNKRALSATGASRTIAHRGCHFAAGVDAFRCGDPRELPKYFTKPGNHNANAWLNGWDYGKILTARPAEQPFETFCENVMLINVHRAEDGKWTLGRALDDTPTDLARVRLELLAEFARQSSTLAQWLLDRFELTLANSDLEGDVVVLSGHKVRGRHFVLNTMLVTPPDILARVHAFEVRKAVCDGEAVHVPHTDVDPREALLAKRQKVMATGSAAA